MPHLLVATRLDHYDLFLDLVAASDPRHVALVGHGLVSIHCPDDCNALFAGLWIPDAIRLSETVCVIRQTDLEMLRTKGEGIIYELGDVIQLKVRGVRQLERLKGELAYRPDAVFGFYEPSQTPLLHSVGAVAPRPPVKSTTEAATAPPPEGLRS